MLADRLLGRHVLRCAEQRRFLRLDGLRAAQLRDPEIEDLGHLDRVAGDLGLDQEDVLRLEVAVDDAGPVRGAERRADAADDREDLVERQRAGREPLAERFALQETYAMYGVPSGSTL